MQSVGQKILLSLVILMAATGFANAFDFDSGPTYASVDASETLYEFFSTIEATLPSGEDRDLYITWMPHVPETWFVQYCQVSTSECFFEDEIITLPIDTPDQLRIDFITPPGDVDTGWVDMRIAMLTDPLVWVEVTYALGHGVVLPEPQFTYSAQEVFASGDPNDTLELDSIALSQNDFGDDLIIQIDNDLPAGWGAQVCHTETGTCYFDQGIGMIEGTISFPASTFDTLRVDFFTSASPDIGHTRIKLHSLANPAIWRALPFRARTGEIPSGVDDAISAGAFKVLAAPNPLRDMTDLRISLQRPSSVDLRIVDITGRVVISRTTAPLGAGSHAIRWNGTDNYGQPVPNGVYFYRIDATGQSAQGKLTIER